MLLHAHCSTLISSARPALPRLHCLQARQHRYPNQIKSTLVISMSSSTASKQACASSSTAASDAAAATAAPPPRPQQPLRYALAIHGGAGVINSSNSVWIGSAKEGLQAALDAGHAVLRAGGSAVDAAVASVVVLENDPHFNAGEPKLHLMHSVLQAKWH